MTRHDLRERGLAIRGLPDHGGHRVQGKESRIHRGHDHHLATEHAGGNSRTSGDVGFGHCLAHWIMSQTRESGRKVSRRTGTRSTKSQADWKTLLTRSASSAKKRIFRIRRRMASALAIDSILFSYPWSRENKLSIGAEQSSPTRASSPANGVPQA